MSCRGSTASARGNTNGLLIPVCSTQEELVARIRDLGVPIDGETQKYSFQWGAIQKWMDTWKPNGEKFAGREWIPAGGIYCGDPMFTQGLMPGEKMLIAVQLRDAGIME